MPSVHFKPNVPVLLFVICALLALWVWACRDERQQRAVSSVCLSVSDQTSRRLCVKTSDLLLAQARATLSRMYP